MSKTLDLRPIAGNIGAEIFGPHLNDGWNEDDAEALRQALCDYLVIVLPGQNLSLEAQKRLTEVFGPIQEQPYIQAMEDELYVVAVLKEADERAGGVFGGAWHADLTFLDRPPAGSVLNAVEIPPYGGDTLWSNQILAYETLPEDLKSLVEERAAIHVGTPYGTRYAPSEDERSGRSVKLVRGDPSADEEHAKPAVLTHPESGRKALNVNRTYTVRFDGMSDEESKPYLERIFAHAERPELTCRHRWSAGDLVIWDNRTTQHFAINDYDGFRRLLYRTTFGNRAD